MRLFANFALAALLAAGTAFAQTGAKEDMKDAGSAVVHAGKKTGSAVKKTGKKVGKATKKGVSKAAEKTAEGADKVADKTK